MKKNIQTSLYDPNEPGTGNCFPAVISCIMDLGSADYVLQIQQYYKCAEWKNMLQQWLNDRGYIWKKLGGHLAGDLYYFVTGATIRTEKSKALHVCIYKNGEMVHDPHPDNTGLISELEFEIIEKL